MRHTTILAVATALVIVSPIAGKAQSLNLAAPDTSFQLAQNRDANDVVGSLQIQGYVIDAISQTLLGRTKIIASNSLHTREIVVSRTTGEILSDTINNPSSTETTDRSVIEFGGKVTFGWNSN